MDIGMHLRPLWMTSITPLQDQTQLPKSFVRFADFRADDVQRFLKATTVDVHERRDRIESISGETLPPVREQIVDQQRMLDSTLTCLFQVSIGLQVPG